MAMALVIGCVTLHCQSKTVEKTGDETVLSVAITKENLEQLVAVADWHFKRYRMEHSGCIQRKTVLTSSVNIEVQYEVCTWNSRNLQISVYVSRSNGEVTFRDRR